MSEDGDAEKAAAPKVAERIRNTGKAVKRAFDESKAQADEKKKE